MFFFKRERIRIGFKILSLSLSLICPIILLYNYNVNLIPVISTLLRTLLRSNRFIYKISQPPQNKSEISERTHWHTHYLLYIYIYIAGNTKSYIYYVYYQIWFWYIWLRSFKLGFVEEISGGTTWTPPEVVSSLWWWARLRVLWQPITMREGSATPHGKLIRWTSSPQRQRRRRLLLITKTLILTIALWVCLWWVSASPPIGIILCCKFIWSKDFNLISTKRLKRVLFFLVTFPRCFDMKKGTSISILSLLDSSSTHHGYAARC